MKFLEKLFQEICEGVVEGVVVIVGGIYFHVIRPHAFKWAVVFLTLCVLNFVAFEKVGFAFLFDLIMFIICIGTGLNASLHNGET